MPNLNHPHFEFAQSLTCDCILCLKWRRWLDVLKKAEKGAKGHYQGCSCNLCKLLLHTRKSVLAAELRLDLWIELGWYAYTENWKSGWEKIAWVELNQTDKWWIITGQYKPIEFWLDKFKELNGKEKNLYDYSEYYPES